MIRILARVFGNAAVLLFLLWSIVASPQHARYAETHGLHTHPPPSSNETRVYIAYGEQNSDCFSEKAYVDPPSSRVYQFYHGETYRMSEPMLGATGRGGCVWPFVGNRLVATGATQNVVFATCGRGGASLAELLPSSEPFACLMDAIRRMTQVYGKVDAILFHQGESDRRSTGHELQEYELDFRFLLRAINTSIPFYLSRASVCERQSNPALIRLQSELIHSQERVRPGPNTDLLNAPNQRTGCSFTSEGLVAFGSAWVESLLARSMQRR